MVFDSVFFASHHLHGHVASAVGVNLRFYAETENSLCMRLLLSSYVAEPDRWFMFISEHVLLLGNNNTNAPFLADTGQTARN